MDEKYEKDQSRLDTIDSDEEKLNTVSETEVFESTEAISVEEINKKDNSNNNDNVEEVEKLRNEIENSKTLAQDTRDEHLKNKRFSFFKLIGIIFLVLILGSAIGVSYKISETLVCKLFDKPNSNSNHEIYNDTPPKQSNSKIPKETKLKDNKLNIKSNDTLSAVQEIAKTYEPAIVSVVHTKANSNSEELAVIGTGIVFKQDMKCIYIVSNQHVIYDTSMGGEYKRQTPLYIAFDDDNVCKIEILGSDRLSDIAVVRVEGKDVSKDFLDKLIPVNFADSNQVKVGEGVVAIGNPLGFVDTTTFGIVSALNRKMDLDVDFIQIDAAINSGNSGGATFNLSGEVIGINTIKIQDTGVEGLGFAVSANDVKFAINQILKHGKVKRAFLGVQASTITNQQASEFNLPKGARVIKVYKNTGADIAGFLPGDIITEIDGKAVENMEGLRAIIKSKKDGDIIKVRVYRSGEDSIYLRPVLKDLGDFES